MSRLMHVISVVDKANVFLFSLRKEINQSESNAYALIQISPIYAFLKDEVELWFIRVRRILLSFVLYL